MRAAATLGGETFGPGAEIFVVDSGDTAAAAAAAAHEAVGAGAQMLLGPLLSVQGRAAANAAGRGVPVVALTNDDEIAGGNLFVFGVTPIHSARAVLGFAAARGVQRIGTVVPPGLLGARTIAAVAKVAPGFGIAPAVRL